MHDPLDLRDLLADELAQRRESGYRVEALAEPIERALAAASGPTDPALDVLLAALESAPRDPAWPYDEPEDPADILASLPEAPDEPPPDGDDLADRVYGAWLGRSAGCTLGKPVEGLPRERLLAFLAVTSSDPREGYLPATAALAEAFGLKESWAIATRANIRGAPRDDDLDYTILGLHILERHGAGFVPRDVTDTLLLSLPYLRVYTAERAAYRNLVHGLLPPTTANHRNPYREWIGALIRADVFGYVFPGRPRRAIELALRDASTSHAANGIYAAMWSAGLLAEALARHDGRDAVIASLRHIPPRSRLAETLGLAVRLYDDGTDWETARARLADTNGHYSWVHAIPNAAAIAAGLLWGDGEFGATVGLTVMAGLDTDSSAATAGSVFGALHGAASVPRSWTDPLEDRVSSAVMGFDRSRISDLAQRTVAIARSIR